MLDQNKIKYLFGGPYDDNSTKSQFNQPGGFREKEFHITLDSRGSERIYQGFDLQTLIDVYMAMMAYNNYCSISIADS